MDMSACLTFVSNEATLDTATVISLSAAGFSLLVGGVGNLFLLWVISTRRRLRSSVPNLWIMNLATADLLLLAVHGPSYASTLLTHSWDSDVLCKVVYITRYTSLGVSVFSLMLLSTDRFIAIVLPFHRHGHAKLLGSKLGVLVSVSLVWLLSATLALMMTWNSGVVRRLITLDHNEGFKELDDDVQSTQATALSYDPPYNVCIQYQACEVCADGEKKENFVPRFIWIRFMIYFLVPFVVIGGSYSWIAVHLCTNTVINRRRSESSHRSRSRGIGSINSMSTAHLTSINNREQRHSASNPQNRHLASRKRLAMTVLMMALAFLICWLPDHINSFLAVFEGYIHIVLKTVAKLLSLVYSCLNPIVLCLLSANFRQLFIAVLLPRRMRSCCGAKVDHHVQPLMRTRANTSTAFEMSQFADTITGSRHTLHRVNINNV